MAVAEIERRFWAKVDKNGPNGCWVWTAANASGYGRFWVGHLVVAHRFAYELLVGPIPDGMQLDHLCRNPPCVNPAHLEPVTCRVNLLRGETQTARRSRQTHCSRGHEFTAANTYTKPNGARNCRACKAIADFKYYVQKKARRAA